MKKTIILFALIINSFLTNGQSFEGTVTVEITYDLPSDQQAMAAMLPKEQVFHIKNEMTHMEQNMMGNKTIMIRDNSSGLSTVLMEMQGMKYKMQVNDDDIGEKKSEIELLDETKEILGYACKKARVVMKDNMGSMEIYYTNELPAPKMKGMEKINGFPLEYSLESHGMKVHYMTMDIKKESIDDGLFVIPEGYQDMPMNIRTMMGMGN